MASHAPPVPLDDSRDLELLEQLAEARQALMAQIGRRIIGQHEIVDNLLAAVLAGGHALLVGVPGLAKTLLVQTLSQALGATQSVDALRDRLGGRVVEGHPEVSFCAMAGQPLEHSKRSWNGMGARLDLLEKCGLELPADLGRAGSVQADDVVDAAVMAWTY